MNRLCNRLNQDYADKGQVIRLDEMWGCWTSDIIVGYLFERSYNFIDQPKFRASFTQAMIDLLEPVHFVTQFPMIIHMINALPESLIKVLQPGMASVIQFNNVLLSHLRSYSVADYA